MIKVGKYEFHDNPWKKISANAKELVTKLMNVNYKERFSPSQALAHAWILNVIYPDTTNCYNFIAW